MRTRRHWFIDHSGNYHQFCAMCGEPFDHPSHMGEYIDEQKTPLSLEDPYVIYKQVNHTF